MAVAGSGCKTPAEGEGIRVRANTVSTRSARPITMLRCSVRRIDTESVPCHKEGTTSLPETRDHLWSSGATQIVIRQTLGMVKDNTGLGPRGPGVSRIAKALLTRGRTSAASCLRQPPGTRHSEA